jgi:tetratricopeptide (TPR) repeat protein
MIKRVGFMVMGLIISTALFADGGGGSAAGSGSSGSSAPKPAPQPTAQSWYALGYQAAKSAKFDEAITDLDAALKLRADYPEALNMKGYSLRKSGKLDEAFSYYEKALALKPNFPDAREYYGEASLQAGDLKKAIQQYLILQKANVPQAKELLAWIDAYVNNKTPPAEDI